MLEILLLCHAAVGRNAVKITVGKQTLCQRREGDEAYAVIGTILDNDVLLWLAVEQVEAVLVDEQRHIALLKILVGKL